MIEILGGRFEGVLYSAKDVEQLSKLPGKQEMRSQFLGLLEAVPSEMLGVIDALLTNVIYCIDNKKSEV